MNFPVVSPRSKIGRAYEILNTFNGNRPTDDRDVKSVRLVMSMMDSVYAEVLQEDISNRENIGQALDTQTYFSYRCVPILIGDQCESCEKNFYVKIPTLAQYNGSPIMTNVYVGDIPSTPSKDRMSAKTISKGGLISKASPAHYIQGDKMYFILPGRMKLVSYVSFDLLPVNPSAVTVENSCFDIWSDNYPIIEYLWPKVRDRISQRLMNPLLQTARVETGVNDGM